jgi:hypothetical protein
MSGSKIIKKTSDAPVSKHQSSNDIKKAFLEISVARNDMITVSLQFGRISGRISGYFQHTVSARISDKSNPVPVSGRIPDIKKAGLSSRISGASLIFKYCH